MLVIYICSVETCVRALGHNLLQKEKIPELVQFRWFRYQNWYKNYCTTHLPTASWTLKEKRKELYLKNKKPSQKITNQDIKNFMN